MKKLRVLTVLGTRPEIIRLSRVISKLDEYSDHLIIHTGQNYNYELNQIFFDDLDLRKPDYYLNCTKGSKSTAETIGNIISKVDNVLEEIKPDALLVLGDTNSCLCVISAKRRKIPIFHMEAGNRCFDLRVPEEINRRIVDHTSDINLTYSSIAREYLLREGLPPDQIIKTGSPMKEVLDFYKEKINKSNIVKQLNLNIKQYFVLSSHREENIDSESNFSNLVNIIKSLSAEFKLPIIFSTHPRTLNKLKINNIKFDKNVVLIKPVSFTDFIKLQINAKLVISDSGTITEEASLLNFPAINLRDTHERPEGMEEASVIFTGLKLDRVMQAINILVKQYYQDNFSMKKVSDYDTNNVSEKIIRIILSYTDFIQRNTWKKY